MSIERFSCSAGEESTRVVTRIMKLLPREIDKLVLIQAGNLAQKRLARGLQINHVEATALICTVMLEHVRDGKKSLTEIAYLGATLLGKRLVMAQVISTLDHVSLEATFPDGTKLITVHNPITSLNGDLEVHTCILYYNVGRLVYMDHFYLCLKSTCFLPFRKRIFLDKSSLSQSLFLSTVEEKESVSG
jgi:urease gamma subunit